MSRFNPRPENGDLSMTSTPEQPKTTHKQVELIFGPDVGVPYEPAPKPGNETAPTPSSASDLEQIKEAENEGLAPKVPHDPAKRKPLDLPS